MCVTDCVRDAFDRLRPQFKRMPCLLKAVVCQKRKNGLAVLSDELLIKLVWRDAKVLA